MKREDAQTHFQVVVSAVLEEARMEEGDPGASPVAGDGSWRSDTDLICGGRGGVCDYFLYFFVGFEVFLS